MISGRTIVVAGLAFALGVTTTAESIAAEKKRAGVAKSSSAQTKLVDFVEAGGCKVRVSPDVAARMREIAANGSVAWKGKCQRGLISGAGVLREEGTLAAGDKTRKVAHHWSGTAVNGMRSGKWKRESFARFADGPKYWANVATVVFVDGMPRGRSTPIAISGPDDYSPGFRRLVAEAQHLAEQAGNGAQDEAPPRELEPKLAVSSTLRPEQLKPEARAAEPPGSSPQPTARPTSVVSSDEAAEPKAGLVVFAESRGCKLWTTESEARRRTRIASRGKVTWQGDCKNGFISGAGVLVEEGEAVIGGRHVKFAYFLAGRANKGASTGQWKRESYEKFSDDKAFTAGIATLEFVDGVPVGTPTPVAVSSWSQYSIGFSTKVLAPALGERSQSASASDSQPVAMAGGASVAKTVDPIIPLPKVTTPAPKPEPPAPPQAATGLSASPPPATQPPAKPDAAGSGSGTVVAQASAPVPAPVPAPAPVPVTTSAPVPAPSPVPAKAAASAPQASPVFSFSALGSAISSFFGPAPAPKASTGAAPKSGATPGTSPVPAPAPKREISTVAVKQIKASSTHQSYGPDGLFDVKGPGWHAATPIVFPQELSFEFESPVAFRRLALRHQQGHPERAPRGYLVEVSADGNLWTLAAVVDDACLANTPDGWRETELPKQTKARFMKIVVTSNCGDPGLLTLLGVRLN